MKKINTFWNWFQDNNQTIKKLIHETPQNQQYIIFWINKNLSYYCREIDFIIVYPKKENSKAEFIVTANGNSTYFQQVTALIDNAPRLRTWNFNTFLKPTEQIIQIIEELEKPYIICENTLKAKNLYFISLDHDQETDKLEIHIYLKNYNILCNTKTLDQALSIIIIELLGEKTASKKISFVQLAQLEDLEQKLIKLYELQYYLDSYKID
jgi:hypothetical protein